MWSQGLHLIMYRLIKYKLMKTVKIVEGKGNFRKMEGDSYPSSPRPPLRKRKIFSGGTPVISEQYHCF